MRIEAHGKPVICVAPGWQLPKPASIHAPKETVVSVLMDALLHAGALPLMMPITSDPAVIAEFVEMGDGFVIPGGQGVDPTRWGERAIGRWPCMERDDLEFELVSQVLAADKPLLCICRGMQLLNVHFGGSIAQDIDDLGPSCRLEADVGQMQGDSPEARNVEPLAPEKEAHRGTLQSLAHRVRVAEGSRLAGILGGSSPIRTNSNHSQAVRRLGEGLVVSARGEDGVIEAIELPGARFCLGVQWHPEYTWTFNEADAAIWRAFVTASR